MINNNAQNYQQNVTIDFIERSTILLGKINMVLVNDYLKIMTTKCSNCKKRQIANYLIIFFCEYY